MSNGKTHYEVLGLAPDASLQEVKRRFRELARKYHPDLNPDRPEMHAVFLQINQAHEVLSDPDRRAHYDLSLREAARRHADARSGSFGSAPSGPRSSSPGAPPPRGRAPAAADPRQRREGEERRRISARLVDEARVAYARGRLREAQRLCEEALTAARHGGAYELLGDIFSRQGRWREAEHNYTFAVQLIPSNSLIMAKLNRVAARVSGDPPGRVAAPRARANPPSRTRPVARLLYRLALSCFGLAVIALLASAWPQLGEARLEWPLISQWTPAQLACTIIAGFLSGVLGAAAAWVRPFPQEMSVQSLSASRRVVPLSLVLGLLGAVFLPLAFGAYILLAYFHGFLSPSILNLFAAATLLACGFAYVAPTEAFWQTLVFGANILFVTMLIGWSVGEAFRPEWAA